MSELFQWLEAIRDRGEYVHDRLPSSPSLDQKGSC